MYIHIHILIYITLITCFDDILHSLTNSPMDFKIVPSVDAISLMNCSFLDSNEQPRFETFYFAELSNTKC